MRRGLLARAPDPARARRLTRAQISAALKRARRRDIPGKATAILTVLRGAQPVRPPAITAAYAATVRSLIAVIITLNEQAQDPARAGGGAFWPAPGR